MEEVKKSARELSSLVKSSLDFLETFDETGKCRQIPSPKTIIEAESTT